MKHEWILDVLTDLRNFARTNDLPALAKQLTNTVDLAEIEISSAEEEGRRARGDEFAVGNYSGTLGDGREV